LHGRSQVGDKSGDNLPSDEISSSTLLAHLSMQGSVDPLAITPENILARLVKNTVTLSQGHFSPESPTNPNGSWAS
jgi:hypothetical protein